MKSIALLKKEVWTWETISTWNLKSGKIEKIFSKMDCWIHFQATKFATTRGCSSEKNCYKRGLWGREKNYWGTKTKWNEKGKTKKREPGCEFASIKENLNELKRCKKIKGTKNKCCKSSKN